MPRSRPPRTGLLGSRWLRRLAIVGALTGALAGWRERQFAKNAPK